jgi:hypothetical protein
MAKKTDNQKGASRNQSGAEKSGKDFKSNAHSAGKGRK